MKRIIIIVSILLWLVLVSAMIIRRNDRKMEEAASRIPKPSRPRFDPELDALALKLKKDREADKKFEGYIVWRAMYPGSLYDRQYTEEQQKLFQQRMAQESFLK